MCAGCHRWLQSRDVINTLGRGISVQEWAPCFSGEVIGKKPGRTGGGIDTRPQAHTDYLTTFARESKFSRLLNESHSSPNSVIPTLNKVQLEQ